jgi:hypothetical protein
MKVIRNTADELVLESRPWGVGIVIVLLTLGIFWAGISLITKGQTATGFLFLICGGLLCLSAFWAFVRLEEVRLSRSDGAVQFRTRSIGGRKEDAIPLSSVRSAILQSKVSKSRSKSGRSGRSTTRTVRLFRPALTFSDSALSDRPLTEVYSNGEAAHQAVVQVVNGWLAGRT